MADINSRQGYLNSRQFIPGRVRVSQAEDGLDLRCLLYWQIDDENETDIFNLESRQTPVHPLNSMERKSSESTRSEEYKVTVFNILKKVLVESMDEAEKATDLLRQQLLKREAVKEILHKHKRMFFREGFQNECLVLLGLMDTLSAGIFRDVLRDEYNNCLERWSTLKKAMDLTTMLSLEQLLEAWKEYAYEAFPTIDDASAYLYKARDIMLKKTGGKVFFQQKNGLVSDEGSSLFQLLALERAIHENTNVDSQLERKLNKSNQENMCLAKEIKELRDKHAQVIDELNIMKRDRETYTSNAMVDSQTQVSSLNEVSSESSTDEIIVKSFDVETMTDYSSRAENTIIKEPDSDPTTAHCSATEETFVKKVDSLSRSNSQDDTTNNHIEQTKQGSSIDSVVSQDHRIEHRNQQIRRQNSTDMTMPRPGTQRNVFERSELVTSTKSGCSLSKFSKENSFKSNDIKSHDLLRRTFGAPILVLKLETKPGIAGEFDATGMDTSPIWISSEDAECIISYLNMRGFAFLCRKGICFYFSVGNRDAYNVNLEIDNMQEALRNICFGRFFGRVVDDHRIESLEDLVISFRIEGSLDSSLWRCYYVLLNNGISNDDRRIGKLLLRKYCCGILLLMLWFMCACVVTKVFRRK